MGLRKRISSIKWPKEKISKMVSNIKNIRFPTKGRKFLRLVRKVLVMGLGLGISITAALWALKISINLELKILQHLKALLLPNQPQPPLKEPWFVGFLEFLNYVPITESTYQMYQLIRLIGIFVWPKFFSFENPLPPGHIIFGLFK